MLHMEERYHDLNLLININADQRREQVFNEIVEKLYEKALQAQS